MPISADALTGLVLAGGRGRRMGGLDKGLQTLRGKPLVVHVLERLAPQTGALIISANRHLDTYAALGAPWRAKVLADQADDDAWPDASTGSLPVLSSILSSGSLSAPLPDPVSGLLSSSLPGSLSGSLPDLLSDALFNASPDPLFGVPPGARPGPLSDSSHHALPGASAGLPPRAQPAGQPDRPPRFDGPLAGLLSGLRAARTGWLLSVPCDAPYLRADLAGRLGAALDAQRADIATARTLGAHGETALHPVFALLRTSLADDLAACLARGERKVRTWFARHKCVEVVFTDERAFYNANSPQDLANLECA